MDRADFSGADLRDAVLNGIIASGSSFNGAQIDGADFGDALLDRDDQRRLCREADGVNPPPASPPWTALAAEQSGDSISLLQPTPQFARLSSPDGSKRCLAAT